MSSFIQSDPRLGYCYYGQDESDRTPAMLVEKGKFIELSILLDIFPSNNNPTYNWFASGAYHNGIPVDTRMPSSLLFIDNNTKSMLINCRVTRSSFGLKNPGLGKIECTHIVHDINNPAYERISGLRSQSLLFKKWTNYSNFTFEATGGEYCNNLQITTSPDNYHPLSDEHGVGIAFDWARLPKDYGFELEDLVYLQTESTEDLPWKEHTSTHRRIYALPEISSWQVADISKTYASTSEDPVSNPTSSYSNIRWARCQTHGLPISENKNSNIQFLFNFHHLQENGIKTWIELSKSHSVGINTFLSILHSEIQLSSSNLIQSGIAFEAIGKRIAKEQNVSNNRIKKMKYTDFLNLIYCDIEVPPPIERYEWAKTTRKLYTSLKHAKQDDIYPLDIVNNLLDNILIFRFWIASRLSIPSDQIKLHTKINDLNRRYDTIFD